MECRKAFKFHTPSSMMVVGPSGCGKTVFTTKLLLNNLELFVEPPKSIHYCYGSWQKGYERASPYPNSSHKEVCWEWTI